MKYSYRTTGTCSKQINFEVENNIVSNVEFIGGCPGNLVAISKLVEGQNIEHVASICKGILCGDKKTSCADQLATAIIDAHNEAVKLIKN